MIGAVNYPGLARKKNSTQFVLSLYYNNQALNAQTTKQERKQRIAQEYHDFIDMFNKTLVGSLPHADPTT